MRSARESAANSRGGAWTNPARALLRSLLVLLFSTGLHVSLAAQDAAPSDGVCRLCHDVNSAHVAAARSKPGEPAPRAHAGVACVDCHAGLRSFDPADGEHETPVAAVSCTNCHAAQQAQVEASAHAVAGVACAQCHAAHTIGLPLDSGAGPAQKEGLRTCAACHAEANAAWSRSVHALDPGNGNPAATCSDCHGGHDLRKGSDLASKVHPLRLPDTCESCHHTNPSPEHPAPGGDKVRQYETSVHGRALREKGLIVTATCVSCHGAHAILPPADAQAPTARNQLPYTCGACHAGILRDYLEGVHGSDFKTGGKDVPVCNDCHTEHAVQDPALDGSSVSSTLVAETCARCHADDELARRYGFSSTARSSWGTSYHGIASSFGEKHAANCGSCHGFHAIFGSADPRSRVNAANLDSTCGGCHPQAGAAFARVPVHSVIEREANFVPWIVRLSYTALMIAVIAAFLGFILIDLFGRLRIRLGWGPPETEHITASAWPDENLLIAPGESFRRMGRQARAQHGILIASFLLLVLTGLPVFLHESGWLHSLLDIEGGFRLRSKLHRIGAVGLIGLSLWHIAVMALAPAARRWLKQMLIRPRDLTDFLADAMFNLGCMDWLARRPALSHFFARFPRLRFAQRPALGRYGLVEKIEYGAVVWGNIVMIATGAILWRPGWFLDWLPTWTFEVCRVVHGFEATLAFLAIIIWHMYHVHLRPGVFPMSRVFLTGLVSRSELRHHHPAEYARLLEQRRVEREAALAAAAAEKEPGR
jgi:cytochrome b subunit of formate dehydrogenase